MIYDLFVDFVGGGDPAFEQLLADSVKLQYALAAASLFLACFALTAFCYMIIIIFRGWK